MVTIQTKLPLILAVVMVVVGVETLVMELVSLHKVMISLQESKRKMEVFHCGFRVSLVSLSSLLYCVLVSLLSYVATVRDLDMCTIRHMETEVCGMYWSVL